jgi:hypothetical protein
MYHKYNLTLKKITLTFETNDEHQARSYQNALRYTITTKLSYLEKQMTNNNIGMGLHRDAANV